MVDEDEMTTFDASVKNPRTLNQAPTSQQPSTQHVTQQPNQPQFKLDFNANSLLSAEVGPTSSFKYFDIVGSMLKSYAQDGDVQTACSILLVLGDRAKTIIETSVQEIWFQSYIGMKLKLKLQKMKYFD